jgi:hypothetical protein
MEMQVDETVSNGQLGRNKRKKAPGIHEPKAKIITANPAKKGGSELTGGITSRFTYRNMLMNSTRAVHQRRKAFRYTDIEEMLLAAPPPPERWRIVNH